MGPVLKSKSAVDEAEWCFSLPLKQLHFWPPSESSSYYEMRLSLQSLKYWPSCASHHNTHNYGQSGHTTHSYKYGACWQFPQVKKVLVELFNNIIEEACPSVLHQNSYAGIARGANIPNYHSTIDLTQAHWTFKTVGNSLTFSCQCFGLLYQRRI